MATTDLLLVVAGVVGIGVLAQLLADRLQVPSIIFYIVAGLVIGEPGLELLTTDTFGDALPTIVGLAVAIIVFEGAFHLDLERIRAAPAAAVRLVTLGAAIALGGTALAVRLAFDAPWGLSFTIAALLVATGPTVVSPILRVVPVRDRVAAALETEGIVNDVTAAILAVVFFSTVNPATAGTSLFDAFVLRLADGLLVGVVVAGALYYLLRYVDLSPGDAPRNARLLVLAGALLAYAVANATASEAGVAAVATAGFLLGNAEIPYEAEIKAFKGDVTLVVLAFVFITLAALVNVPTLLDLGLQKLAVVLAVAVVIRPTLVWLSTVGDRFTRNERIFMSAVGPRGIIPASVATLFAVELRDAGLVGQADVLLGTVFLAILLTAVFEAGLARPLAVRLNIIPMRVIIVGGGQVGRALAQRLEDRGENVVIVEESEAVAQTVRQRGYTVIVGDGTHTDVLREAGAENAKIVAATTGDDDANLLVTQLAKANFDVERVLARANDPDNVDAFEELGVRTISSAMATAWAIDNQIERPAIAHWMTDIGRVGDVQEVEVTNPDLIGKPVSEVGPMLPEACLIALVSEGDVPEVPSADYEFEAGDHVTLLGRRESVREGMAMMNPDRA